MTPDAQVLRFPGAGGAGAPEYGLFSRELSEDELAGYFFFSEDDRARIASRREVENRLGFAVQLGTVRYLGRFSEDPSQVPAACSRGGDRRMAAGAGVGERGESPDPVRAGGRAP